MKPTSRWRRQRRNRSLKPGNILFDQYGNAYLSDFGIARVTQTGTATLTGTAILGTPAYMSPEQIQGDRKIDGRSDIYALGAVIFQMLTGQMPYQADTPAKMMMMHVLQPVPQILDTRPDLPPGCDALIIRAMALGEVHLRDWWRVMRREILSGLSLGTILGTIGFIRISMWALLFHSHGEYRLLLALTVGLALVGIVLWGTLAGSMLPFLASPWD